MLYSANGLFSSIGTTFTTPNGATVTRREAPYRPVAAVQKTRIISLLSPLMRPPDARWKEIARNDGTQERHHRRSARS